MQWLINDFKALKAEIAKKLDEAISKWAQDQIAAAERIVKLENEIKAMKARMGRKQD
jgi:hypothetical protein